MTSTMEISMYDTPSVNPVAEAMRGFVQISTVYSRPQLPPVKTMLYLRVMEITHVEVKFQSGSYESDRARVSVHTKTTHGTENLNCHTFYFDSDDVAAEFARVVVSSCN